MRKSEDTGFIVGCSWFVGSYPLCWLYLRYVNEYVCVFLSMEAPDQHFRTTMFVLSPGLLPIWLLIQLLVAIFRIGQFLAP